MIVYDGLLDFNMLADIMMRVRHQNNRPKVSEDKKDHPLQKALQISCNYSINDCVQFDTTSCYHYSSLGILFFVPL